MEAGEYGLTRGTCFVARRLEVVAVAWLLWISWCVLGAADFFVFSFFRFFPPFERTRPAAKFNMRPPCLIYLSTSRNKTEGPQQDERPWPWVVALGGVAVSIKSSYKKLKNVSCEYNRLNG